MTYVQSMLSLDLTMLRMDIWDMACNRLKKDFSATRLVVKTDIR